MQGGRHRAPVLHGIEVGGQQVGTPSPPLVSPFTRCLWKRAASALLAHSGYSRENIRQSAGTRRLPWTTMVRIKYWPNTDRNTGQCSPFSGCRRARQGRRNGVSRLMPSGFQSARLCLYRRQKQALRPPLDEYFASGKLRKDETQQAPHQVCACREWQDRISGLSVDWTGSRAWACRQGTSLCTIAHDCI